MVASVETLKEKKMPINIQDFIDLLAELFEERKLRGAVTESLKGGLITGVSAALGGLLLGPIGLAIGGAAGGGASAIIAQNRFRPVALILRDMTPHQKEQLYEKVKYAFRDFGPQDVAALSALVLSQTSLTELAVNEAISYLRNDMNLQIH